MKNTVKKPNVKPCKNRDLMIPDYSALPGQGALILAAVLVSWCAITLGANTAQAQSTVGTLPYPKGVWGAYGVGPGIPSGLVNNLGIVGIGVTEDWDVVNPAPGVYDWSSLDYEIAQAKAAGFKYIHIGINNSSDSTPTWLLDGSQPINPVTIDLLDPGSNKKTFCGPIKTALYWDAVFHQARLDLIAAAGAHYSGDPAIIAYTASFANHSSMDWNIQDTVGTLSCPPCPPLEPDYACGDTVVDQPAQWLPAGWTEQEMLQVGEDILDAVAAAFPNQNIKLPIGGLEDRLASTDIDHTNGTYTTLCRDIENYVYGNASLGIPAQPYANRVFMQRNTVDANWGDGTQYDTFTPGFRSLRYIKYMIRNHAKPAAVGGLTPGQAGLQMVSSATLGASTNCRQGAGPTGPCGATCDPVCVMQDSLDVARTYNTTFIEISPQDSQEPAFYSMIEAATLAMGGTLRDIPTPDLQITVTDGGNAVVAGQKDTYTIVVTNSAPSDVDVTGAVVSDSFPAKFAGVTFTATQSGGASGFTGSGTGNLNDIVTMPAGSVITYKATGKISPSATGTLSNTATVAAPSGVTDFDLANNSATDTDTIKLQADLRVTVTDQKSVRVAGQKDTYTIVVTNLGPSDVTARSQNR